MKAPNWREWLKDKKSCKNWLDNYTSKGMLRKSRLQPKDHLHKAQHNLDFANWVNEKHKDELPKLFGEERFYDWVISGYYYAIYHASLALIASKDYTSKSHHATLCAIIYFFHHEKLHLNEEDIDLIQHSMDKTDIEIITETKELRERASYGVSGDFEIKLVNKSKENAIYFINRTREILQN